MKIFFSWLIANIGGVVDTLIIIIFEVLLFKGHINHGETDMTGLAIAGPFLIIMAHALLFGSYPSKNILGDIFNICILILGYVIIWFGWKNNPSNVFMSIYFWGIIPSLVLAVITAVFTANNMDDVVSLRMLYVNSDADIFEETLLYTFNRFVAVFSASSFVFLCIALLNKFYI